MTPEEQVKVLEANSDAMDQLLMEKGIRIDELESCLRCIVTEATWGPEDISDCMNLLIERAERLLK